MALKGKLGAKFGKNNSIGSKSGGVRNKFKKVDTSVLEKIYKEKDDKSKGASGKSPFNQELLSEYGIKEYSPENGDNYFEVLPLSFSQNVPYCFEIPIHYRVGIAEDAFVCTSRYNGKPCYRCEEQSKLFKENSTVTDEIKALYPTDRICFLVWNRTGELVKGETPTHEIQIWAAPKSKIHSQIQGLARSKVKKTFLDISDVEEDGDGRTVSYEYVYNKGSFPEYKAVQLIERDGGIPDEILEQLDTIITAAEEAGFTNAAEMFFHIPTYDEVKTSMVTEQQENNTSNSGKKGKKYAASDNDEERITEELKESTTKAREEEKITEALEELHGELEGMSNIKFKLWCKANDYAEAIDIPDKEEAIDAIIEDLFNRAMSGDDNLPF